MFWILHSRHGMVVEAIAEAPVDTPADNARAFRLLMTGSSFSLLGSRVTDIAYPMLVLYLTRSPLIAGWAACAVVAPSIFVYVPAGVLVDRLDPRHVMLVGELGRCCSDLLHARRTVLRAAPRGVGSGVVRAGTPGNQDAHDSPGGSAARRVPLWRLAYRSSDGGGWAR